jgi:site-specific DNA-methyltransferase (adenine-specific)
MDGLREMPDNYIDLAIVDPPYGIGAPSMNMGAERNTTTFYDRTKKWDTTPPDADYFDEMLRVSSRSIVWGGNYFALPASRGFVVWDKKIGDNDFAMCEYAWLSWPTSPKIFAMCGTHLTQGKRIHPTQKPVELYKYLLSKYAKEGDLILDTHMGSGSSYIACLDMGFDYIGYEIDQDYFTAIEQRVYDFTRQTTFDFDVEP